MPFEIQHFTLADGWVNTVWDCELGTPIVFPTLEAAKAELTERLLAEMEDAVINGDMSTRDMADEASQYRIMEVE